MNILRKLFGRGNLTSAARKKPEVQYKNFTIIPRPQKTGNGWSTEAIIRKQDGEHAREHVFLRADSCNNEESAVQLTINKAKSLIDQQGDEIFSR